MTEGNHTKKKTSNQVGRHQDLNSGPPEYETSVLPLRCIVLFVLRNNVITIVLKIFAASLLKKEISYLIWLTLLKFFFYILSNFKFVLFEVLR